LNFTFVAGIRVFVKRHGKKSKIGKLKSREKETYVKQCIFGK